MLFTRTMNHSENCSFWSTILNEKSQIPRTFFNVVINIQQGISSITIDLCMLSEHISLIKRWTFFVSKHSHIWPQMNSRSFLITWLRSWQTNVCTNVIQELLLYLCLTELSWAPTGAIFETMRDHMSTHYTSPLTRCHSCLWITSKDNITASTKSK